MGSIHEALEQKKKDFFCKVYRESKPEMSLQLDNQGNVTLKCLHTDGYYVELSPNYDDIKAKDWVYESVNKEVKKRIHDFVNNCIYKLSQPYPHYPDIEINKAAKEILGEDYAEFEENNR